jgi:hypothetical protein
MSNRITEKDLQALCDRINDAAGTPREPYGPAIDGHCNPQARCYHLAFAYGGVALHQMSEKPGCTGIHAIIDGYRTKRELYEKMLSYLDDMAAKGQSCSG